MPSQNTKVNPIETCLLSRVDDPLGYTRMRQDRRSAGLGDSVGLTFLARRCRMALAKRAGNGNDSSGTMRNRAKMERPEHLPEFDAPPLTEVALSLQFQPIARFGFVDFGPLRERFRPAFERVEYHPPLPPVFETFGLRQGVAQGLQMINFGMGLTLPRLWLMDKTGNELLQFQVDRLVHNWRKIEVDNVYPRYEQIRVRFETEAQTLMSFLSERELGSLVPNQCEITYVNTIGADGAGDPTHKVLRAWTSISNSHLGEPEDIAISARFLICNDVGDPIGRVIAQSTPGLNAAGQPVVQLALVGRGPPAAPTLEAALQFMDIAHERVVWAFAELTTEVMHKYWKRRN
jgi:uncharacterized protein (TIGR04255 family)